MEVWEAGDGILVRVADQVPTTRLEDTADIGQDRLLGVGRPGRRRGGREPGEATVVEHPVDGEGDRRTEHGPAELAPHFGGSVRVERAPERCVERGGVRPRRRRGEVVNGDPPKGLVQRGGHGVAVAGGAATAKAATDVEQEDERRRQNSFPE